MSSQIHLRIGAEPWLPTSATTLVKELRFYDIPLAGIIEQHGRHYLFECLEGHTTDANMWVYIPLLRRDVERLWKLTGEKLAEAIQELYLGDRQGIVAALALGGRLDTAAAVRFVVEQEPTRREISEIALRKIYQKAAQALSAAQELRLAI